MIKPDPYRSFMFRIEINGIDIGFSEVRGLQVEFEIESYREGGVNDSTHVFSKGIKYQPLILKRGIPHDKDKDELSKWIEETIKEASKKDGPDIKKIQKDVAVVLKDETDNEVRRWTFHNAYPIKWTGPELKADSNTIAFESIELAHKGFIYT